MLIDDNGSFTDDFREALPGMLGDEHKEFKDFDDISDMKTLVGRYAATKSMVGKKLEGVIQKPTDTSTDDDKAAYRKTLLSELGAPDSPDGYQFARPELPEGMEFNEEVETQIKDLFHKTNTPPAIADELVKWFNDMQIGQFNKAVEADNAEFEKESTATKTKWQGELLPTNLRIALKAVKEFVGDDVKKQIDEAKLYDNVTDLSLWRKLGFKPSQIDVWHNIAKRTLPSSALKDEGGQTGGKSTLYPNTTFPGGK